MALLPQEFNSVTKVIGKNKKLKSTQFCHTTCGKLQTSYADSVALIKDCQWDKIIPVARCFVKASHKAINSAIVIQDDDTDIGNKSFDAHAHLIESDSESGTHSDLVFTSTTL